jgi:hypothetical protein
MTDPWPASPTRSVLMVISTSCFVPELLISAVTVLAPVSPVAGSVARTSSPTRTFSIGLRMVREAGRPGPPP